jgi:hypothetical protein
MTTEPDFRKLAEDLMVELAQVRGMYETATHDHPFDEVRNIVLAISGNKILKARQLLYPDIDKEEVVVSTADVRHLLEVFIDNGMVEKEDEEIVNRLWATVNP